MIYSCAYLWLIVQKGPFFGSAILVDYFWWHQYRPWTSTVTPQKLKNLEVKDLSEEKKTLDDEKDFHGGNLLHQTFWVTDSQCWARAENFPHTSSWHWRGWSRCQGWWRRRRRQDEVGGKDHPKFSIQDKQLVVGVDYANKSSIWCLSCI